MRNKFKLKKKLISIALALALATQPLTTLPMNVFAGTGENGMLTAPLKADLKELNYGQQIKSKYIVQKSVDFSDKKVLSARIVQAPGIVYAKEKIGNSMRDVYIIADINEILRSAAAYAAYAAGAAAYAAGAAQNAANIAHYAAKSGEFFDAYVGYGASYAAAYAAASADADAADADAINAFNAAYAAAEGKRNSTIESAPFSNSAASWVANAATANAWANSYNNSVGGVIDKLKEAYAEDKTEVQKKWLVAAYGMAKVAAHIVAQRLSGKGLDLEAKLKVVYACYRVAEAVWFELGNNQDNVKTCQDRADALQKVIDSVYSDPVGDIAEQAAEA